MKKNNNPRYSDQELKEFEMIISNKIKKQQETLRSIERNGINANGTNDTSPGVAKIDNSQEYRIRDENWIIIERLNKNLQDLQRALDRIRDKTYGVCSITGTLINKERLKIVPHTTKSAEAKMKL